MLVFLRSSGDEMIVRPESRLDRDHVAVESARELIVPLRHGQVRSHDELERGGRHTLEESLDADLGRAARIEPAMEAQADGVLEHLSPVLDPHPVDARPGTDVVDPPAAAQGQLRLGGHREHQGQVLALLVARGKFGSANGAATSCEYAAHVNPGAICQRSHEVTE